MNCMTEVERRIYEHGRQTNFDRITVSPEALAEFIAWQLSQLNDIHECDIPIDVDDNLFKKEFWLVWLKQESEQQ